MPRVKNWMFVNEMGAAVAPEVKEYESQRPRFFGEVYDDLRSNIFTTEFNDGHRIITSPVCEVNWKKRFIKTKSGTIYYLEGYPHEDYVQWLKDNNIWEKYCNTLLPMAN